MDNVSQLFTAGEYVAAGGASTHLEKLIPGNAGIIQFPFRPDRNWTQGFNSTPVPKWIKDKVRIL